MFCYVNDATYKHNKNLRSACFKYLHIANETDYLDIGYR